jgi:maltooligosyltrehalose trehalohydrolase
MKRWHEIPFGAALTATGGASCRLRAPGAQHVDLVLPADGREWAMQRLAGGWFEVKLESAAPGLRYFYRIDGTTLVPDPASRCNPDDVHGASEMIDPQAFDWPDFDWRGRLWYEADIYELHLGQFTPVGSFIATLDRLADLMTLGVTVIELMPVVDFPGRRGWGYGGVLL